MTNLTNLEAQLLNDIAYDEMTASNGARPESANEASAYLWADERAARLGISEKAVGGVLTSLQKKGLIGVTAPNCKHNEEERNGTRRANRDPDGAVWFTDAGYEAFVQLEKDGMPEVTAIPLTELDEIFAPSVTVEAQDEARKYQVNRRYNKDSSITLYKAGGKKIYRGDSAGADAFLEGWFGTADQAEWKIKNEFAGK